MISVDFVLLGFSLILIVLMLPIVLGKGPIIVKGSPRLDMVLSVLAALDEISEDEAIFISNELGSKIVPNSMAEVIAEIRNARKTYTERLKQ